MGTDDDAARASVDPTPDPGAADRGYGTGPRWVIAALSVAVWIVLGFVFRLSANAYLLLSIPFVVAFQLAVARQPLRRVWLRDATRFAWDVRTTVVFVLVAIVPAYSVLATARHGDGLGIAYGLAAVGGAAGVAVTVRAARRVTVRQLLICVAVVCAISVVLDLLNVSTRAGTGPTSAGSGFLAGAYWFLLYLPAVFVVEEVFFRGVLDSYVRPAETGTGWLSATYVSALWGLWHLPIVLTAGATTPVLAVVVGLLVVQIALGIPLSLGWRRSGSLLVPGTAHALSDAIRNVLVGLP